MKEKGSIERKTYFRFFWFASLAILQHTKNHEFNLGYHLVIAMSQINKYWIHSFTAIFISSIIFPVVSVK